MGRSDNLVALMAWKQQERRIGTGTRCTKASPDGTHKRRYLDEADARRAADLLNTLNGHDGDVYRCRSCRGWHVTRRNRRDMF